MLFNSGLFLQFFAGFLLLYWLVRNQLSARNFLIVAASYVFYGAWDWRFLSLLAFSSLLDFAIGIALERAEAPRRRNLLLTISLAGNLGILCFFKYYDFFVLSFNDLLAAFQVPINTATLGIILPLGISFYTFQTMSYTIDVYRREIPAEKRLINFLAFVSFFPQLVAGPIERARHLLPQFERTLVVTVPMIRQGVWLVIWGLFKKVVIADNIAPLVEIAFDHPAPGALLVILGAVAFALQIYGDFSAYSDIARGIALFLGFDLMWNFNLPYTATNLREFWARWHISLSTWLRDYLYIPLGGNRGTLYRTCRNLAITMLLGGLWHGARWNFVLWGAWHGLGLIALRLIGPRFKLPRIAGWFLTMSFVLFGWLLFRATSLNEIIRLTTELGHWTTPHYLSNYLLNLACFSLPFLLMEYAQHKTGDLLAPLRLRNTWLAFFEGCLLIAIAVFWEKNKVPFIYFQF